MVYLHGLYEKPTFVGKDVRDDSVTGHSHGFGSLKCSPNGSSDWFQKRGRIFGMVKNDWILQLRHCGIGL